MKARLSLGEFRSYLSGHRLSKIVYLSEDQPFQSGPCRFRLSFSTIAVSEQPNLVVLKRPDGDELWLSHVRSVEVDEDSSILGTVFRILCEYPDSSAKKRPYILLAS